MANPSFSIDDELLEEFDEIIFQKKVNGDLPRDASRSSVLAQLVEDYVEGNRNTSTTNLAAASSD